MGTAEARTADNARTSVRVSVKTTKTLQPVQSNIFHGPFVIRPMAPIQPALRQWENVIG